MTKLQSFWRITVFVPNDDNPGEADVNRIVAETLKNVSKIWAAIKGIGGLGRVGHYDGVYEVDFGFEGYRAGHGADPRHGSIGEDIFLGRATLTTYVTGERSMEDLEGIAEMIKSAHSWEQPVIEFSRCLLFVPQD
jgi:hypothetical protein